MSRYIDADKLVSKCEEIIKIRWNNGFAPVSWGQAYSDFIDDIDGQPTADVAEVKHGGNITTLNPVDSFVCSECLFEMADYVEVITDNEANPLDIYEREFEPKYCPNCGAKMDGDKE